MWQNTETDLYNNPEIFPDDYNKYWIFSQMLCSACMIKHDETGRNQYVTDVRYSVPNFIYKPLTGNRCNTHSNSLL